MDADITFSIDPDAGTATFSASSPQGEKQLGDAEVTVSLGEAERIKADAVAAGLKVEEFP